MFLFLFSTLFYAPTDCFGRFLCSFFVPRSFLLCLLPSFNLASYDTGREAIKKNEGGPEICSQCVVGKARSAQPLCTDSDSCEPTSCGDCGVGLAAPLVGQENCTVCSSGKFAAVVKTVECQDCTAGRYTDTEQSEICTICPGGYFSADAAATLCNGCLVGTYSPGTGEATECTTCKATPDTLYAGITATECTGCVSPLEIRIGSLSASVNDCACPDNTYLSKGTLAVSPVCSNCPDGGYCPQGTSNITEVSANPGYWRPNRQTKQFWKCPVSVQTQDGTQWRNWMTCYGGKKSKCAPVFDWRNMNIKSGGADMTILQAMEDSSIPVSITQPGDFNNYLNQSGSSPNFNGVTLSHAIAAYVSYVHSDGNTDFITSPGKTSIKNGSMDFLEFFGKAEGTLYVFKSLFDCVGCSDGVFLFLPVVSLLVPSVPLVSKRFVD